MSIFYFEYGNKNSIREHKTYKTKFLWQVLNSETPLKDLTILAEQGIQKQEIIDYIYSDSGRHMYENINFDLIYNKKNKNLNIKRIYFQGVGTKETTCWTYLEEINIPISNIYDKFSYDNINEEFTCINDYKKNNALSLNLEIDKKGYLIKKELIGNTLQKKDYLGKVLIDFYYKDNLLMYSNIQTKQNLYVEKQKNKEIYKDKEGNVIRIYASIDSFSEKHKQNLINKIFVMDNKNNILETIIFEYD